MLSLGVFKMLTVGSFIAMLNADSWYLSNKGNDTIKCGTKQKPCKDFKHVIKKASPNDIINFKAEHKYEDFNICKDGKQIEIDSSLTIRGFEFVPMLGCSLKEFAILINGTGKSIEIKFEDVAFKNFDVQNKVLPSSCKPNENGLLKVINANISIQHCFLTDLCTALNVEFVKKSFSVVVNFTEFNFVSYVLYSEELHKANIQIDNAKIIGTAKIPGLTSHAISLNCYEYLYIRIENTAIQQTHEGLSITVHAGYPQIILTAIIFSQNSGQSIIITFGSNTKRNKTSMRTKDVQFVQNSGFFASALHLVDKVKQKEKIKIIVEKSFFHDNQADTFFGSVYADGVSLQILDTVFTNNIAGEVHGSIQGFGGAIYVEANTDVLVKNSTFINNTCSGFGGTIFSRGSFSCINCEFIGASGDVVRPLLGDILYATAGLHLVNTTWQSTVMKETQSSLIWHPGSPTVESWGITVLGFFKAACPEGHNISHSGIIRNNDVSSRMTMSCKPCPRSEYSLTTGALTVRVKDGIAFEIEKIIAKCHRCKYGGVCLKGSIRPQANYYGYRTGPDNDEVRFISCPIGYCCQGDGCQKYNSCQKHRNGSLCGKCKDNMSENLINSNCVPPEECNDFWFWFLFIPSGFLYIFVFMYLDHISYFLKTQLIWWNVQVLHRDDLEDYDVIDGPEYSSTHVLSESASEIQEVSDQGTSSIDRETSNDRVFADLDETDIFGKPGQNQKRGPDLFTDLITISFYFFQMFLLIRMRESIVFDYLWSCLRSIYSSIFTLSVHANSSMFLCPIRGLTAVTKLLFIKSFSCYVLVLIFTFHLLVYLLQYLLLQDLRREKELIIFSVRLKVATIRILLIAYATIGESAVTLVTCTPMTKYSVLLIDGTITCYTWWQSLTFIFVFTWVVPFPVVLVMSLIHLKEDTISYHQFVLSWIFPLPYLIWSLVYLNFLNMKTDRIAKGRLRKHENFDPEEELSIKEILFRLECSYVGRTLHNRRNSDQSGHELKQTRVLYRLKEPLFWQGALIGRRLVLILTLTFVTKPVMKYYSALLLCTLYLIHQLHYRPYVINLANIYETGTSALLVIFCSMNLFFAYSYVSDLPPEAADENLSFLFRWFEAIILVILPTLVALVLFCLVFTRMVILVFKFCQVSSGYFRILRP